MAYTDQLMRSSLGSLSSTGGALGPMGLNDVGSASDYFQTLLRGNRQNIMQAAMPGMNLALDQEAGRRRNAAAFGTNRTGGTAANEAQAADDLRKNFDMLIGSQQSTAAQNLANISNEELGIMSNILGNVASTSQADVASRRAASAQMWSSLIGGATGIAGAFIGKPPTQQVPKNLDPTGRVFQGQLPTMSPTAAPFPGMSPLPPTQDPTFGAAMSTLNPPQVPYYLQPQRPPIWAYPNQ